MIIKHKEYEDLLHLPQVYTHKSLCDKTLRLTRNPKESMG